MQGRNPITSGQTKALAARLVNAIPTALTMEQADLLIRQPNRINFAVESALATLLDVAVPKGTEYDDRFTEALRRVLVAAEHVSRIDHRDASIGLNVEDNLVKMSRLLGVIRFVFEYAAGRTDFLRNDFKIDLSSFGFVPYGRENEIAPTSFDELKLVRWGQFIPEEAKVEENPFSWKVTENYVASSKACGQITAEWVNENRRNIPKEWRKGPQDDNWCIYSFPGNGWRHEGDRCLQWCLSLSGGMCTERMWLDRNVGPTPRHDAWVVCRV